MDVAGESWPGSKRLVCDCAIDPAYAIVPVNATNKAAIENVRQGFHGTTNAAVTE